MPNILTADQLLIGILALLKVHGVTKVMEDGSLDQRFERIYELLVAREKELGVRPNFTFYRNPLHGNSTRLRNALLAARENGLVTATPGPAPGYELTMSDKRAHAYLENSPLNRATLDDLIRDNFKLPSDVATAR
ncbi:hypothetical protein [Trinickia dinghuensis]|uniref:Uncharacterized protein n=1 Tax=Trinickia dinghuensis TaxID=2291023 RepID=A0A3D8JYP2_9BURK|nr:hypothetical protein [Trinickia dinghuensis]RDU98283.1 hypothetical protein DWV00_13270 [Trinickia dinghuensis]